MCFHFRGIKFLGFRWTNNLSTILYRMSTILYRTFFSSMNYLCRRLCVEKRKMCFHFRVKQFLDFRWTNNLSTIFTGKRKCKLTFEWIIFSVLDRKFVDDFVPEKCAFAFERIRFSIFDDFVSGKMCFRFWANSIFDFRCDEQLFYEFVFTFRVIKSLGFCWTKHKLDSYFLLHHQFIVIYSKLQSWNPILTILTIGLTILTIGFRKIILTIAK